MTYRNVAKEVGTTRMLSDGTKAYIGTRLGVDGFKYSDELTELVRKERAVFMENRGESKSFYIKFTKPKPADEDIEV